jgi:hypothetical protein
MSFLNNSQVADFSILNYTQSLFWIVVEMHPDEILDFFDAAKDIKLVFLL